MAVQNLDGMRTRPRTIDNVKADDLDVLVEDLKEYIRAHGEPADREVRLSQRFTVYLDAGETLAAGLLAVEGRVDSMSTPTGAFNVSGRSTVLDGADVVVFTDDDAMREVVADVAKTEDLSTRVFDRRNGMLNTLTLPSFDAYHTTVDHPLVAVVVSNHLRRIPRQDRVKEPGARLPATPSSRPHVTGKFAALTELAGSKYAVSVTITGPCRRGDDSTKTKTAMGGSPALAYAIQTGLVAEDSNLQMEWLHLWGSAIGGDNIVGNLVAGSFDANTAMIPFETDVVRKSATATDANPLVYTVTATLQSTDAGPTWVASHITQHATFPDNSVREYHVAGLSEQPMPRIQYKILAELFRSGLA